MKFSEASLKPSSDEKYFRYFISCYFSDLNGGCEACVCISVMYCGLRGLSIFQSQLLQTIISCFVQLKRLQRTRTRGFETKCPLLEAPTIRFIFIVYDTRVTMHREKLLQGKPFEGFGCLDLRHWRPASYSLGKISIRRLKSLQRTLILISH